METGPQQSLTWATVWPQQTWAEKWGTAVPLSLGEAGSSSNIMWLGRGLPLYQVVS